MTGSQAMVQRVSRPETRASKLEIVAVKLAILKTIVMQATVQVTMW